MLIKNLKKLKVERMNRILLNSFRTKLIFVALLFCVLFSLSAVNAADNHTDNVLCGSDSVTDELVLDSNFNQVDNQALKVDQVSKNNLKASPEDVNQTVNQGPADLNTLQEEINNCTEDEYVITRNYTYDWRNDDIRGINITRDNFTIDGQGHTIDGDIGARFFHITGENVTLKNINFINGVNAEYHGLKTFGVVNINGTGAKVLNCNFTGNGEYCGVALCLEDIGYVYGCNFINNHGLENGGAVLLKSGGIINSSYFINNIAVIGSAIYTHGDLLLLNTRFDKNVCRIQGNPEICKASNATVTMVMNDFKELNQLISECKGNVLTLNKDFAFNMGTDSLFKNGIQIIKDNFVIDGAGHSIDGSNFARIFNVTGKKVTFKNISFLNGNAIEGGAIYANDVSIKSCTFSGNFAEYNGAAIFAKKLTLVDSIMENNSAFYGAGAYVENAVIQNSIFTNNVAYNSGGALYIKENGSVKNSNFTDNCATYMHGGSVYMNAGEVDNCKVSNSSAGKNGGAVYINNGTVKGSVFENCSAKFNGGAVFSYCDGSVEGSTFAENNAGAGGGVYMCGAGSVVGNTFVFNHAVYDGDNLYNYTDIIAEGNFGI